MIKKLKRSPSKNDKWEDIKTTYLAGDLVKTEYGLAIIRESNLYGKESYSIWPLPGWIRTQKSLGWQWRWYPLGELKLVEAGPASKLRSVK